MKLLLTNDDGIDAPGLAALEQAAKALGEVHVVAPTGALSGCSHRVTTDEPLCLSVRDPSHCAVAGTPADCVRVGLYHLAPDTAWVLSGINHGGNMGADVHHSGTVAAVREAVLHGWPGIAVSHYHKRGMEYDWQRAAQWVAPILEELMARPWREGTFWNINLPHLEADAARPDVIYCPVDSSPLPLKFHIDGDTLHYHADYHARSRRPGADVDVCFGGRIAVSEVALFP